MQYVYKYGEYYVCSDVPLDEGTRVQPKHKVGDTVFVGIHIGKVIGYFTMENVAPNKGRKWGYEIDCFRHMNE